MNCRFCNTTLKDVFIDLINAPASNSFLVHDQLNEPETYYPLKVYTCSKCFLVQVDEYKKSDEIFNSEYVYFSSFSTSWLAHCKNYVDQITDRFNFNEQSLVVEIASNDGYLLQYFKEKEIPVLGIEPTKNTAAVAIQKGIDTVIEFFGVRLAESLIAEQKKPDLILGNNVLAHVPDIVDFVAGMKKLLKPAGVITMEFPHLLQLVENAQFDTIYHEHFSYLSFHTVKQIFESNGLQMFDVEEILTHGGSLRIYAKHAENEAIPIVDSVAQLINKEIAKGVDKLDFYSNFTSKVNQIKVDLLEFLVNQKKAGKKVAAYGAAAKGNTLLNYCGVKNDLIDFVVDANPAKQNKFLPGSHIPVVNEQYLKDAKPDFVIILPWNIKNEIQQQLKYIKDWNANFVVAIPAIEIIAP
ncbi:methyltransferase domain-containing protein [Mucilaginibacter sp. UYCu711]|uniref:methyltransferase domain-containing protein n=1 Tax=Mucilaginibacter sp. UYCu711 TaxID=3156339 RepID=UPI003D24A05A